MSSVDTEDMSSVATEDMSSVATEDMSSVATEDMSNLQSSWLHYHFQESRWPCTACKVVGCASARAEPTIQICR